MSLSSSKNNLESSNTNQSGNVKIQIEEAVASNESFEDLDESSTNLTPQISTSTFDDSKRSFFGPQKKLRKSFLSKRRLKQRLVFKNGDCNIRNINIEKRRQRYLADIFTTLIDIKWRYILLIFVLAFALSWLLFAFFWWLISFSHGDFDKENLANSDWQPCIENVNGFTTALLFSIETQHTIGYGSRMITPSCSLAITMLMCQSVFGVIVQALMAGLMFAKLSRPKRRAETLLFSKKAVICQRDGQYCLLIQVGDMRRSRIVEPHVTAFLVRQRKTAEGEVMPLFQHQLEINHENGSSDLFLAWPVILEHRITADSPFYNMSEEDLFSAKFELIVILEGVVESTGMTAQVKTSYLPEEILWGHRFCHLMTYHKYDGGYIIDYSLFNSTKKVDMPKCSASELENGRFDETDKSANNVETHLKPNFDRRSRSPLVLPPSYAYSNYVVNDAGDSVKIY